MAAEATFHGFPLLKRTGVYIFSISKLDQPVMAISINNRWPQLALDTEAKRIYANGVPNQRGRLPALVIYSPKGEVVTNSDEHEFYGTVRSFVVHPAGQRMLISTTTDLYWVEIGESSDN